MLVYGVGFHTSIQIFLLFFFFKISPNHNNSYLRVFYSEGKGPIIIQRKQRKPQQSDGPLFSNLLIFILY